MKKTIIFDFAGVLTYSKCFPQIAKNLGEKYGIDSAVIQESLYGAEGDYLLGKESTEDFWKKSCGKLGISFADFSYAFKNWYVWDDEIFDYIEELGEKYEIVLHSDNFEVLSEHLKENLRLKKLFDYMVFSNEIGFNKTQKEAFEYTLNKINKSAGECVFTDDKAKNLVAPKSLGIEVVLYKNFDQFKVDLAALLEK